MTLKIEQVPFLQELEAFLAGFLLGATQGSCVHTLGPVSTDSCAGDARYGRLFPPRCASEPSHLSMSVFLPCNARGERLLLGHPSRRCHWWDDIEIAGKIGPPTPFLEPQSPRWVPGTSSYSRRHFSPFERQSRPSMACEHFLEGPRVGCHRKFD